MSAKPNSPKQNLQPLIAAWLQHRQQLLSDFNYLCSLRPFDQPQLENVSLKKKVAEFCEKLVDYISVGQFDVFETLFSFLESMPHNDSLTNNRILSNLIKTASEAVYFNDKYSGDFEHQDLEGDLTRLGESLAFRLELEDTLIEQISRPGTSVL